MDYEKKYKEALERAKEKYPICYSPALLEYIFPELKENKDIEIKKDIISNLKRYVNCIKDGYDASSAKDFVVKEIEKQIAWLEKQGNKDSQIKLPTFTFDDILALQCCMETVKKVQNDKDLYEKLNDLHGRVYDAYHLEKQGEQKPVDSYCQKNCRGFQETGKCFTDGDCKAKREAETIDKVKPKFKVGDWISNDMCDTHIASIEDGMYYFDEGDGLSIVFVDEHYHLWTIEDAKNGDVLFHSDSASNGIFIFKEIIDKGFAKEVICYCDYDSEDHFCLGEHHTCCWTDAKILYPATKEQRDTLFAKMKEAGYTFDFEKKELKKLGQPEVTKTSDQEEIAEIPFGAKDSELQEATYFIPKGFHAEIDDDDKVVIKKGERHTAWSEENRKRIQRISDFIWKNRKGDTDDIYQQEQDVKWLKSLKDRVGCEANYTTTKEWSEEDEHRVKDTIYFLDTAKKHYASTVELDACIDWLKFLKQRIGG